MSRKLTTKQEAFCLEYAKTGNATQSAISAGYAQKTAYSQGQRLLKNVEVQKRLQDIAKQIESEKIADITEIQKFLTSVMRNETIEEVVVVEGYGEGCSSARTMDKDTFLKDRIKAAETLAKMQGAFDNKLQLEVTLPVFGGEDELED